MEQATARVEAHRASWADRLATDHAAASAELHTLHTLLENRRMTREDAEQRFRQSFPPHITNVHADIEARVVQIRTNLACHMVLCRGGCGCGSGYFSGVRMFHAA